MGNGGNMKKIISLITFFPLLLWGQVNYEPVTKSVYEFLNRVSIEGYISIHDEIEPFSRIYIAGKLQELMGERGKNLSTLEYEELRFYIRDFAVELQRLGADVSPYESKSDFLFFNHFGVNNYGRYNLFEWQDSLFSVTVNPILGYDYSYVSSSTHPHRWNGLSMYGSIGANVGFEVNFRDNLETGKTVDFTRSFSRKTGYTFRKKNSLTSLEYDEVNANLTFSNSWGSVTIGKDYNYYGEGLDGKLILGSKAPSFPQLKIEVSPVSWFKFSYIHGWLNSQVTDSMSIRSSISGWKTFFQVPKFIAAHMFSFTAAEVFNFTLGESVIYSDRFQPMYLIPVLFFRIADHYLNVPDNSAGNAQLFWSCWYKVTGISTKIYGNLFIDELSLEKSSLPHAIGYTIGFETVNPLIEESEVAFEYTKIEPFVYFHREDAQFYSSYNYQLGHWIGSNGDEVFFSFKKRILRGFSAKVSYAYVRKGSIESRTAPRYAPEDTFLYGLRKNYQEVTLDVSYEVIHDLVVRGYYQYRYVSDEDATRTPKWQLGANNDIGVSAGYGL